MTARATKDVDGIIRGDMGAFFEVLDHALCDPWGPISLRRGEIHEINVPTKRISPRRFDVILSLRGVTWRRIQFEVSPDEAGIGKEQQLIDPPSLRGFGLPDPDVLVGIALRFQIAQKLYTASDPHDPPGMINDRARDVVDLLLLRDLCATTGHPTKAEICEAGQVVFQARAAESLELGTPPRSWPPTLVAHPHWQQGLREGGGLWWDRAWYGGGCRAYQPVDQSPAGWHGD